MHAAIPRITNSANRILAFISDSGALFELPLLGFIGVFSLGAACLGLALARMLRMISVGFTIAFAVLGLVVTLVTAFGVSVVVTLLRDDPGDQLSFMFFPMIFFVLVGLSAISIFFGAFTYPRNQFFVLGTLACSVAFIFGVAMYLIQLGWF